MGAIFVVFALVFWPGFGDPSTDFESEILPIFQRHCLECHGNGKREGELDLETLARVRMGGHSGSPLLAEKLDESELYLRVTSTTAGYRMPKKGEPLSATELKTLAAWIQTTPPTATADEDPSGSATDRKPTNGNDSAQADFSQAESAQQPTMFPSLSALTPGQFYQAIGVSIAIALLLLYLVVRAVQTLNKKRRQNASHDQPLSRNPFRWVARLLVGAVLCVAVVGFGYYYFLAERLSKEVKDLSASVARLQPKATLAKPIGPEYLPLPPSPMHPLRLGGRYYRGNDERDPELFNGGFYRTATIDLQLVDAAKSNQLQWEDEAPAEMLVEITIDRAPQATRELFTDRVREAVSLQHYNLDQKIAGDLSQFDDVETEQRWRATIALPKTQSWENGRTAGMIYLMHGVDHNVKSAAGSAAPRPHFGIRYEVELDQGKITKTSTLWMGSMYTLGGRVLIPTEGQVLLDRWFDWRPIPVIEGEGSSDPELLGLPEHLRDNVE